MASVLVGERADYAITVLGQLVNHVEKKGIGPVLRSYTKINCKWLEGLNVIDKIFLNLGENIERLYNPEYGKSS